MKHVFDPETLHCCSKAGVGLSGEAMLDAVTAALREEYPAHVSSSPREWFINNAGGAMGQVCMLYASLSEYLFFFNTPIGTEGHSGRYPVSIWDFMIEGTMWCYNEGQVERREYQPGDAAFLDRSEIKGYRVLEGGCMLEYGRGFIPGMLPFGLADALSSTLELPTIWKTLRIYTKHVLRSQTLPKASSQARAGKSAVTTSSTKTTASSAVAA